MDENYNNDKFATRSFDKQAVDKRAAKVAQARKELSEKKKKKKTFVRTFAYAIMVLTIAILLSIFAIDLANDALGLVKPDNELEITVEKDESLSTIAKKLETEGIIKYPGMFKLFTKITGNSGRFQYGIFALDTNMDYLEICTALKQTPEAREEVKVTIPEGYELREIFEKLEEDGVCTADELYDCMESYDFDYDFVKEIPNRDNKLEGYLFPDTYIFYKNDKPENVLKKFLDNFDSKFSDELRQRAEELGYSIDDAVTLASVVEREAADDSDRATVASVFVNRLNSSEYPYLQSCATVQYVLKERKSILSIADTKIDSPYNTYMYRGLPIGPIASPGLASIEASLYPDDTNYYFFVVDSDGVHHFSRTLDEHNAAVKAANSSKGTGTVG